jgi:predicted Zn finger-like uncharacterized protein
MIIECGKCRSKFKLDESRIKQGGSKVRCSLCKEVFVVYLPSKSAVPSEEEPSHAGRAATEEPVADEARSSVRESTEKDREREKEFERLFAEIPSDLQEAGIESTEESYDFLSVEDETEGKPYEDFTGERGGYPPDAESRTHWQTDRKFEKPESFYGQKRSFRIRLPAIVLLILLILIAAAGALWFWAPQLLPGSLPFLKPPESQVVSDSGVNKLNLRSVTGTFIDSQEGGRLFVVRGEVKNNYAEPRSFIELRSSILDEEGRVVRQEKGYAGNLLNQEELAKLSLQEIRQGMQNRYGSDESNVRISPGGTIPFAIVFANLPENISEFTVEPVGSSSGAQ